MYAKHDREYVYSIYFIILISQAFFNHALKEKKKFFSIQVPPVHDK